MWVLYFRFTVSYSFILKDLKIGAFLGSVSVSVLGSNSGFIFKLFCKGFCFVWGFLVLFYLIIFLKNLNNWILKFKHSVQNHSVCNTAKHFYVNM